MSWEHVPTETLRAFVMCDMAEDEACTVALHLDGCPLCARRAAGQDPLAGPIASLPDPVPPEGLAAAILADVQLPSRAPWVEVVLGVTLLVAAGVLTAVFTSPVTSLVHASVVGEALRSAGWHAVTHLSRQSAASMAPVALSASLLAVFFMGIRLTRGSRP